jgi:hypothetical protein
MVIGSRRAVRHAARAICLSVPLCLLSLGCDGEDITPPEVAIISPAPGDSISGVTIIRARGTDNQAVWYVEFLVDSVRLGIDSVPAGPIYEYEWYPAGLLPGTSHRLRCVAVDRAGNRKTSLEVPVSISRSAGTHHRGTISTSEVWTFPTSPHIVDAALAIEAFVTIQPGVTVLAAENAGITVGAHSPAGLLARGRVDSVITFTSLNPAPSPGAWAGIEFQANSVTDSNLLSYCNVRYAGANSKAAVSCQAGGVRLDSSDIRYSSSRGVWAAPGGLALVRNTAVAYCGDYPITLAPAGVDALGPGNTFTGNSRDAIELQGGTVARTDTWPQLGVPYCITATITVAGPDNPLLAIAPGCSLLFADSAGLRVGVGEPGALRADGSYGRIIFAPLAASPGPGRWRGLEFWEKTDSARTVLNYCRIQGAGAGNSPAITCYSVPISLTGTRIADNAGAGVYCVNAGFIRLANDTVTGCAGYPLHIAAQYLNTIGSGNSFSGNAFDGIEVTGGTIARDAQWRRQNVPYLVRGSVEVGSGHEPALVIDPGVVLRFDPGATLAVGRNQPARLQAVGDPDSITFTAAGDEPLPGSWGGLELHRHASSSSRVERCRLLYGGGAGHGIIYVDSCLPVLKGNEVGWSSNYCIYAINSEVNPDSLREQNWLHDWAPGFEDIYYEP